jgi:phage baseplate assembly protein W
MAKAFSIEDGNQNSATLVGARGRSYNDIDLAFIEKPSGDLYKKTQAAAVKQAVKNLLMTGEAEKPFNPSFGGNLGTALFELDTEYDARDLSDRIYNTIELHEPRAKVLNIDIKTISDRNQLSASITFEVVNIGETVTIDINLTRLR